jgi:hypothetical protein
MDAALRPLAIEAFAQDLIATAYPRGWIEL